MPAIRAYLLHLTHYDPSWMRQKAREKPFDLKTALLALDAMHAAGMNTLVIDIKDGVRYARHPELRRRYSAPMSQLRKICARARELRIDVVPKLNFSKSARNHHDEWMQPHDNRENWTQGLDAYFKVAHEVIGELVRVCRPGRYFHLGMDEDHSRSLSQYVRDTKRLATMVRMRGLKPVIWNDSCYENRDVMAQVHADKNAQAEPLLSKSMVQIPWDYDFAFPQIIRRLRRRKYEVWVAAGRDEKNVRNWKKAADAEGARGILLTRWVKCSKANRAGILSQILKCGPLLR